MRPRSLGAWEIAPIDSTRIKLFETGLRSPGDLLLFSNGRITAAVLNEHNPATGVNLERETGSETYLTTINTLDINRLYLNVT